MKAKRVCQEKRFPKNWQTGFRGASFCTSIPAWAVSNGYQTTRPMLTALELQDYFKAFDHIWERDSLLHDIERGREGVLFNRKARDPTE